MKSYLIDSGVASGWKPKLKLDFCFEGVKWYQSSFLRIIFILLSRQMCHEESFSYIFPFKRFTSVCLRHFTVLLLLSLFAFQLFCSWDVFFLFFFCCLTFMHADDEFGEKTVSILLDGEESEIVFIDHPSSEMSVSFFFMWVCVCYHFCFSCWVSFFSYFFFCSCLDGCDVSYHSRYPWIGFVL